MVNIADSISVVNPAESLSQLPSHYWQWRGWQVHYTQLGEQGPNLLLLHGFGASTDHWRKNILPLSAKYRVWAIDLLGFGRSQKPALSYTAELWREQLQAFCEQVIQAPVFVAGNSLGGYVTLCFGVDCPELTQGVILLNCAGPFSTSEPVAKPFWQQQMAQLQRQVFQLPGVIEVIGFALFHYTRQRSRIRQILQQVYKDTNAVTDRLVEEIYRPAFDEGAFGVFCGLFKTPPGRKVDHLLQDLKAPLLLLWGAADPWMTLKKADKFVEYAPSATLTLIDAGHCPHDERPEEVNQALDTWVSHTLTLGPSPA